MQSEEHVTFELGVVSLSLVLSVEITKNIKIKNTCFVSRVFLDSFFSVSLT